MLFCFPMHFVSAQEDSENYVLTANSATIFELPDFSSSKLHVLNNKDIVSVKCEDNSPVEYGTEIIFYKVNLGNVSGYVVAELLVKQVDVISSIPNFNASTNSDCLVHFLEDTTMKQSEILLNKGQRIFLYEGFDSKSEYTAICFVKNNQVIYGYLKTDAVSPDGINPTLIVCVLVIIAVIGIIFAWVFMKNNKTRIKQKKQK